VEYAEFFEGYPLVERVRVEIVERFEAAGTDWPLVDRLLALEALGSLPGGDPRLEWDLWVDVPAGDFEMGGDDESVQSVPRHRVHVDGFRIAWRPITVSDFVQFATASDGEHNPPGWTEQLGHPNRPEVNVDWNAAMAFCRWASGVGWRGCQTVDLPTEAEWEYAARGPAGEIYPWGQAEPGEGDQARANFWFDASPREPSPIGAFPKGDRLGLGGRRIVDLAGNVWEWCRDSWRDAKSVSGLVPRGRTPKRNPSDPARVVRGGSWSFGRRTLRATARGRGDPAGRGSDLGFRVVCRGRRDHAV